MLRKICLAFLMIWFVASICYAGETQEINSNELKYKTHNGDVVILTRKNYVFFSMIHQPLAEPPEVISVNSIKLPIISTHDFASGLGVYIFDNKNKENFENFVDIQIKRENARTDRLACTWDQKTLEKIPDGDLAMSNAAKGYLVYGNNFNNKPMKIKTIAGFLQKKDNSKFLKLYGIVSVNPANTIYDNEQELAQYIDDLKVYILTTRFEEI